MTTTEPQFPLTPPHFESASERRIIGLSARYSFETNGEIPGNGSSPRPRRRA